MLQRASICRHGRRPKRVKGEGSSGDGITFDDLPLVDLEKEVFSDCGAWKNFHDLEDSLTLEELSELYDIAVERQNRMIKMMAAINGVDLEDNNGVSSDKRIPMSSDDRVIPIRGADDISQLGYGLGYESASSE